MLKGCKKILVNRIPYPVDPLLFVHFSTKTAALFGWIGQFAKAVRQFDAARIELETLREARIIARPPRQCRFGGRVPGYR